MPFSVIILSLGNNQPRTWFVDHVNQFPDDAIVMVVYFVKHLFLPIPTAKGHLCSHLCLCGFRLCVAQLADESRLVPPLPPGFGNIGAH